MVEPRPHGRESMTPENTYWARQHTVTHVRPTPFLPTYNSSRQQTSTRIQSPKYTDEVLAQTNFAKIIISIYYPDFNVLHVG